METTRATDRVADAIAQSLARAGVTRIFTLSGNQIMALFDACLDAGIELVHVRHEAAAVHMADAWGRLTGHPGVALVTAGPGHGNAISALYTASCSDSPLVLLSGHAPVALSGRGAFQELDQAAMAAPVSKAAWTPTDAGGLVRAIEAALELAVDGVPGPVQVSMPVDLLEGPLKQGDDVGAVTVSHPEPGQDEALRDAIAAIASAARPILIGGPMLARAPLAQAAAELAAAVNVPLVISESPRGLRDPALGAVADLLPEADLVVLLGKRADFTLGFGAAPAFAGDCRFIDLQPDEVLARRHRQVLGAERVVAWLGQPVAGAIATLAEQLVSNRMAVESDWRGRIEAAVAHRPEAWADLRDGEDGRLHPVTLFNGVADALRAFERWTLVCDGGEVGQWAQALLPAPRRLINGPSGSIGSAVPMAIAASLAHPEEPVVAIMGDGTFGFHLAELDTAVRYGARLVVIVANDARWNAEYQIQLRSYGAERLVGCELLPTRYDQVVAPFGVAGAHVDRAQALDAALAAALWASGPACINVALDGQPAPVVTRAG